MSGSHNTWLPGCPSPPSGGAGPRATSLLPLVGSPSQAPGLPCGDPGWGLPHHTEGQLSPPLHPCPFGDLFGILPNQPRKPPPVTGTRESFTLTFTVAMFVDFRLQVVSGQDHLTVPLERFQCQWSDAPSLMGILDPWNPPPGTGSARHQLCLQGTSPTPQDPQEFPPPSSLFPRDGKPPL